MKNTTDSTHAATQSYEEQRNGLNFFEKVLTEPGEPEDKRKEVLEYCSNQAVEERTIWRKLALFREMGSTEHLYSCTYQKAAQRNAQRFQRTHYLY
jgi:hypothetical protein